MSLTPSILGSDISVWFSPVGSQGRQGAPGRKAKIHGGKVRVLPTAHRFGGGPVGRWSLGKGAGGDPVVGSQVVVPPEPRQELTEAWIR